MKRLRIHVDGVVQGVGFRPFIYGLAARWGLTGWVLNNSAGVDIEAQGAEESLADFVAAIGDEAPPLARVERVSARDIPAVEGEHAFEIRESEATGGSSLISPDVATCPDCLAEILDPANRRYRYPFTNCTNCGPRYTIIEAMPYDRASTTMRGFTMCPECKAEYENPLDRRFHAQPNACPVCGPKVALVIPASLEDSFQQSAVSNQLQTFSSLDGGQVAVNSSSSVDPASGNVDDIERAAGLINEGRIVAVKGLGGFHLACDATNESAVGLLRERKHRPDKPFAVMIASLDDARRECEVGEEEAALLASPAAPIVLLYRKNGSRIAGNVAPQNPMLGVMLPPTPLHHLLLRDAGRPLVMTSGNPSDAPIEIDEGRAVETLGELADAFLVHDRPIHMRCDDAVWWVDRFAGTAPLDAGDRLPSAAPSETDTQDAARQPLRRSRGDAPYPVRLAWESPRTILAAGAEMKNTFCLLRGRDALISQHIGEMTSLESVEYYRAALDNLCKLFRAEPEVIACDAHPGYLSSRIARDIAAERGLPLVEVQHHHAHIAACLAEHGREGPVIGVALDGTGYGPDGAIWGGEILTATLVDYQRAAHIEYLPLPGGDAAIHRPYRIAWGYLLAASGSIPDLPALAGLDAGERRVVERQVERGLNCPPTSSCGRLFDAVAAMTGMCTVATFEAQAAIALELAARRAGVEGAEPYPFSIDEAGIMRVGEMLGAISGELLGGIDADQIAARFHVTVARMAITAAERSRTETGINAAALSGGSFQNRLLLRLTRDGLRAAGFEVLTHRQVPANDGGLSLGQAAIAARSVQFTVNSVQ